MPIFVFRCQRCHKTEDRFYASFAQMCLEPAVRCLVDGSMMERIPAAPAFKVEGFSYANGYAKESK